MSEGYQPKPSDKIHSLPSNFGSLRAWEQYERDAEVNRLATILGEFPFWDYEWPEIIKKEWMKTFIELLEQTRKMVKGDKNGIA